MKATSTLLDFRGFINLIVYRCLKTFIIMAKIDLKFIDEHQESITSSVNVDDKSIKISINYVELNRLNIIYLDKSTAIKFAKTLRTEINKIN